jgi:translation initiation factor IF-2
LPPSTPAEEAPAVSDTVVRRRKKTLADQPAKIIRMPEVAETPESEEPEPVTPSEGETSPQVMEDQSVEELESEEKVEVSAETIDKKSSPEAKVEKQPEVETKEQGPKTEPQIDKGLRPEKKKRKGGKETPAKIIRMAEPEKVEVIPDVPPVAEPQAPATAEGVKAKEKKKKKGWGEGEEADQDKRFLKKKITFKKREVVEGADLYGGKQGRKGRKQGKGKQAAPIALKPQITTAKAIKRRVKVDETIALSELAKRMGIKANEMIAKLMGMGVMATVNQIIDYETASLVAAEFDYEVEKAGFEEEVILKREADDPEKKVERPPVVTIMGHVDHGKTSLLDVIRKTKVTEGEAGGITQHIGAYYVTTDRGQIVFLDTPGHEAFTAMRSRGASVTDIVILVVAADDGVMPQTVEAINHSKAAEVPIIVAINKMDKPGADPDRVIRQLSDLGLAPEEWGGSTIYVRVSAKKNTGIEELLEMVLLQAEILELKANPEKLAVGHVVEAKLDAGRGPVATVLVQDGTLRTGDAVVCGVHYGKVRSLLNDRGRKVEAAGPAIPVEIIGLSGVPQAGDEFMALSDEKDAKQVSLHRTQRMREKELAKNSRMSLEKLFEKMREGEVKDLNIIIKADVHGSIEALRDSLQKLSNVEVNINVIHSATGTINESDVSLAAVSDAIIIGFNVRPTPKVQAMATEEHVDMRFYNIIYNVIKDIKDAIAGMMSSTFEERVLGRAEVRQTFNVPKVGTIAGCYVTDGKIERGQLIRVVRDGVVIYDGKIASLRRYKDDAKEVPSGYECGIGIERFNDIKVADILECYYMEEVKPEIE